ncbi:MAG: DUF4365 domain-containing protein [Anaerolineae bacterium]
MPESRRFSREKQQELISRGQLVERFAKMGWTAAEPQDLGEDYIVSVYFEGKATGVSFYVQLKSTKLKPQCGGFIAYPFQVKDLKHWSGFALPVVLIVWDVSTRKGRWTLADAAISELDHRSPKWRSQRTTRVRFAPENGTNDAGLQILKAIIGLRLLPMIAKGRELEIHMKFVFGNDSEGKLRLEALERMYKEGEPADLPPGAIKEIRFSPWLQPWLGDINLAMTSLQMTPLPSAEKHLAVIDIWTPTGIKASLPNIELSITRGGAEVAVLSNEHQHSPIQVVLRLNKLTREVLVKLSLSDRYHGYNVSETLSVLAFCGAMAVGGRLSITYLEVPGRPMLFDVPARPEWSLSQTFCDLVTKLCVIQERTGVRLRIPEQGISGADAVAAEELLEIIANGKTTREYADATWTVSVEPAQSVLDAYRPNAKLRLMEESPESHVKLLGVEVPTGPMTRRTTGVLQASREELEKAASLLAPGEPLVLSILGVEITEEFADWRETVDGAKDS